MAYVLDTCALIWWTLDPEQLSKKAKEACNKMAKAEAFVSSISLWELGIKIKNKKIDIGMGIDSYVTKLEQISYLTILPVDTTLWLKNISLDWKHKDPADRTIVATALQKKAPLITKDEIIREFYSKSIW